MFCIVQYTNRIRAERLCLCVCMNNACEALVALFSVLPLLPLQCVRDRHQIVKQKKTNNAHNYRGMSNGDTHTSALCVSWNRKMLSVISISHTYTSLARFYASVSFSLSLFSIFIFLMTIFFGWFCVVWTNSNLKSHRKYLYYIYVCMCTFVQRRSTRIREFVERFTESLSSFNLYTLIYNVYWNWMCGMNVVWHGTANNNNNNNKKHAGENTFDCLLK